MRWPCISALASSSSRDPVDWPVPRTVLSVAVAPSLVCHWSATGLSGWVMLAQGAGPRAVCSVQRAAFHVQREGLRLSIVTAAATATEQTDDGQPLLWVMCLAPTVACTWLVKKPVSSGIHAALKPRQARQAQQLKPVHDPNPESQFECPVSTRPSRQRHPLLIDTPASYQNNGSPVSCPTARYEYMWRVPPPDNSNTRPRLDST